MGVPSRSTVLLQPTTHCLVNITEQVRNEKVAENCYLLRAEYEIKDSRHTTVWLQVWRRDHKIQLLVY